MASDTAPVTDLANKPVFTADGWRVGHVVDVILDLDTGAPVALAIEDVETQTVGGLPADASGVRVPYRLIRGVGDVVVLAASAREAAFPLPGSRDAASAADRAGGRRDEDTTGDDANDPIV
ncbi:PRC-barrel domain-containing protein [Halobaculum limi]|uniref:PRC-barrel domain-containing protein n=1 Tax=Halobaculum limi TaxID=3031916 RepID=UPI002406E3B7|nr:PRC-barrel domain-containing protein [Halobaculum sp. YSMS11]